MASSTSAARSSLELAEDLDLVVLGQLLEDVGELLVVERGGDLDPALGRQLVQDAGEVGGVELLEGGQQVGRALAGLLDLQPAGVAPLDGEGLAAAAQALAGTPDEQPGDRPVAGALLLDADVLDHRGGAVLEQGHRAVEQLAEHQGLGGPLLEAAHVDQAGRDDLAGVDGGHPGHRHEDPAAAGHLDDQAEDAGLLRADAQGRRRRRAPGRPGRPSGRTAEYRPGARRRPWSARRSRGQATGGTLPRGSPARAIVSRTVRTTSSGSRRVGRWSTFGIRTAWAPGIRRTISSLQATSGG